MNRAKACGYFEKLLFELKVLIYGSGVPAPFSNIGLREHIGTANHNLQYEHHVFQSQNPVAYHENHRHTKDFS